jgi:ribosomal protein L37AE/L43A
VSRSLWRCRNPECSTPHRAVLGRVTADGGLVLDPAVRRVSAYFDTKKAVVVCPVCGTGRAFRGTLAVWNG